MNYLPGKNARLERACLLAVVTTLVSTLVACENMGSGSALREEAYSQSSINRAIMQGAYNSGYTHTVNGGVRELVRVDSPGPTTGPSQQPPPGGIKSIADASHIGLTAAQLNMAEPTRDLTLQEAIYRTTRHALDIKVESYNPAIKESLIIQAMAALDPVFFGSSQWTNTDEPSIIPASPNLNNGQSWQNQAGIKQLLPSGAEIQATATDTWHVTDTSGFPAATAAGFNGVRTTYTANINLSLTQPLLRGFGASVTEANIYLAQRDYSVSLSVFKQRVMTSVANVEEAYENLVLARTNVEVLERLVVATEQTYTNVKAREGIDATKASIAQALEAVYSRRGDLMDAQKTYREQSDRLRSLMNDPEFDVNSNILINPVDKPLAEPMNYDADESVETALQQRPELTQARLQVERADIVVKVAQNGLLPKLDLTVGLQPNGVDHTLQGSVGNEIDPMNSIDFSAGIKLEIPIGNRDAEATLRQRVLERRQALEDLVQVAQKVVLDVRTQAHEVETTYEELALRDAQRQASADEFEGIIEIEDIRPRTPEFLQLKLDSQARLANAEQLLIQALVNYNLAIMRLEQSKGTLLEFDRISLDRPPAELDDGLDILRFMGQSYQKNQKK